ncbi:MAG: hypothetical protein ACUVR3_13465, partial [Candidatus Roseilinea sp.]|uniref:hypothetical protein n=1 Tax=Candidatus Roseilinea sp. TaxID=2838777 RepID=UPI00404B67EF
MNAQSALFLSIPCQASRSSTEINRNGHVEANKSICLLHLPGSTDAGIVAHVFGVEKAAQCRV